MDFGVTKHGFIQKRMSDIVTSLQGKMHTKGYENFAIDPYSPEGVLLGIIAAEVEKAWAGVSEAYSSRYYDMCVGIQLDRHGKNIFLPRILGKFSTTIIQFSTDAEIIIPGNTLIRIRDTDLIFKTISDLSIGSSLMGITQAIAINTGSEYNTNPNTITEMVNTVNGIISLTNTTPATGGDGIENDDIYREALKIAGRSRGGSTVDAITTELRKLPEVNGALVLENVGDSIDENGVDPGKIKVFIEGIQTKNIARTLHSFGAFGIKTQGKIEYQIENVGGQVVPVAYNSFVPVPLYVKIVLINSDNSVTQLRELIVKNIQEYVRNANYLEGRKIVHNQLEAKAYSADDSILELEAFSSLSEGEYNQDSVLIPSGSLFYAVVEVTDGSR